MEDRAKIIKNTVTPRFAAIVSFKYANMSGPLASKDLEMSNTRPTSCKLIQGIAEKVSDLYIESEEQIEYKLPDMPEPVFTVIVGVDGTTTPIRGEGFKESMCGTLSLYDKAGKRMHTIYVACAPEGGKGDFKMVMDWEITKLKKLYPKAKFIGLADGAKWNWEFYKPYVSLEILDFYHATERLGKIAQYMRAPRQKSKDWMEKACSFLKHEPHGARKLLEQMKQRQAEKPVEVLGEAITYFENNKARMKYWLYQKSNFAIGSGVTEAACKVVAKQRLNNSGMRWSSVNAQNVLAVRGLVCTEGRYDQFWDYLVAA